MNVLSRYYLRKAENSLLDRVLELISASELNPQLNQTFLACIENPEKSALFEVDYVKLKRDNYKSINPNAISYMELLISLNEVYSISVRVADLNLIIEELLKKRILIYELREMSKVYLIQKNLVRYFGSFQLLKGYVLGFSEIAKVYSNSIFVMQSRLIYSNKISVGTGFLYRLPSRDDTKTKHLIITNKHVVTENENLEIFDKNNSSLVYKSLIFSEKFDIAAVVLSEENNLSFRESLDFSVGLDDVTDEIITMGYPPVPHSTQADLLIHKGEINSIVYLWSARHKMIVFSAKTFPGNSGGPIINELGKVVGMVTQSCEYKYIENEETKIFGEYYMGILASDIIEFIDCEVIPKLK